MHSEISSNVRRRWLQNLLAAICLLALPGKLLAQQPACYPNGQLPSNFLPFSQVYYITGPNADGDYLTVGRSSFAQYSTFPLAAATNQQYCQPLRLAANLTATAYVTTASERSGNFSRFAGLFIDPLSNNVPFTAGIIPANRLPDLFGWRIQPNQLAAVSAASYRGPALARESIVTVFGAGLATATQSATSLPLPTTLVGTTVMVRDRTQVQRAAPLFFVSPGQLNFLLPPGTLDGAGAVVILAGDGAVAANAVAVASVAPGLFAANANGQGVAAAVALRIKAAGAQSFEPVARFDAAQNAFVPVPLDLGQESEQLFLLLFGTGLRFRSALTAVSARFGTVEAPVAFAGAQPDLSGLDQVNVRLPRSLAGRGNVDLSLTVDGQISNTVQLNFR